MKIANVLSIVLGVVLFLIAAQWTIEPLFYVLGFSCVIVQVASRKQWNLVALNLNGLIAWTTHLLK